LFIPVKAFFIGGFPIIKKTSYPTLVIRKSYETLLPCSIEIRMLTGSYVFCTRRSLCASMEENDNLPAYVIIPYAAFFITCFFMDSKLIEYSLSSLTIA
jgi:hypothetical protein